MKNLVGGFEKNGRIIEVEHRKQDVPKKEQVAATDQKHLKMATEWLRRKAEGSRSYLSSGLGQREIFTNGEGIRKDWQHLALVFDLLRIRGKLMPLILKRRIWWEPVAEATSYVVYVSKDRTIFDPPKFTREAAHKMISKEVNGKVELIIPDEWPEFPMEPGTYHIGITARDCVGNESDPLLLVGQFKFFAPLAPATGGIETL
jgi:hypothetical protein